MNDKLKPNFTQIPNYFLDELFSVLSVYEITALIWICRKTYGWHKKSDKISVSQFMKHTPLRNNSCINALKSLEGKKIIRVIRQPGKVTEYYLNLEPVCETNNTPLPDKQVTPETPLPDKHTKESNINKVKEKKTETDKPVYPFYSIIRTYFSKGYTECHNSKWSFSGRQKFLIDKKIKELHDTLIEEVGADKLESELRRRGDNLKALIKNDKKKYYIFTPKGMLKDWQQTGIKSKAGRSLREIAESI